MRHAAQQLLLDFMTAIIFIVVYASTGNLPLAVGLSVAVGALQIGYTLLRGQRVDAMVWLGMIMVIGLGAAALIAKDPRYVMFKPSLIHIAIAVVMLRRGWFGRYLPDNARARIPPRMVVMSGYVWAGFMLLLAATNAWIAWRGDFAVWAWFASVGLITAKLAAFALQGVAFRVAARRNRPA